ncbi:MAG: glycerophosphodiester phosphodiesterase [Woeseiaceae bacterium]|nr:glycerophosphodiester phosphodiesterase [Woeseiaceae bacterium]NIP20383.1 glycerophosphodiester phosphodiesterase [Woeseiaceae bacterium]NIS89273.1 glycerophosphodiester phosphodiesterase [Woeseiaceae bacterium]
MTLVIAHRGASGYLPEHTLEAKTLAFEMGADYLEQDIVASRDDELLVLHDIHLDRVSDVALKFPERKRPDGRYYVRDFDLAEIRTLKAWERMQADGTPVYPGRYPVQSGDFRFNTLDEELSLVQKLNAEHSRRVGVYPEIKRPAWHKREGVDIAPLLLATLKDHGYTQATDPVFVQCFDDAEVRRLRSELDCPFPLVQLIGENTWFEAATDYTALRSPEGIREIAQYADAIGPHISHLVDLQSVDGVPVVADLAGLARDAGLQVHPYTFRVDDLPPGFASFDDLVSFFVNDVGVDGLFTDFPDRVLSLLKD